MMPNVPRITFSLALHKHQMPFTFAVYFLQSVLVTWVNNAHLPSPSCNADSERERELVRLTSGGSLLFFIFTIRANAACWPRRRTDHESHRLTYRL
jgi:hypothetical protein